jgi:autotransporter-associated beta strand protein
VVNWTNNLADMNVASGATFDLSNGQDVTIDALNGSGTITRFYLEFGSPTLTLGIADGSGDFSGTIASEIALIKTGIGTQILSGTNTYSGNTTVNAGTLRLGNGTDNSNLADSADVFVAAGATLDLDFTGTDTIDELWLDGVAQAPGIYGAGNSGGFITGSGTLTVQNGPIADPCIAWI